MAYRIEQNGDIVINGFDNGIGDSPYSGFTDMRNMNILSVPGEAAINYSTANIASGAITGTITSASGSVATYTGGVGLEDYVAIFFTSVASYSGISTATPYWVSQAALSTTTFALYTDYKRTTGVTFSGNGSATFKAYQMGFTPDFVSGGRVFAGGIQYFSQPTDIVGGSGTYYTFGVDAAGLVWGNQHTTGTNSYWTYTGNTIVDGSNNRNTNGNGLVYWRVTNGGLGGTPANLVFADYLFVFRNSQIDYMVVQSGGSGAVGTGTWTNGWVPATAGSFTQGQTGQVAYLTTPAGSNFPHAPIVGYDGRVYFCDGCNVQKFFQTSTTTIFNPTDPTTFTGTIYNLLPIDDASTCLTPLGNNMLIGAQGNLAYQWNTTSNLVSNYIPIAESYISKMVTVNTNVYMFAGNRGRIYVTNGSQANLWKKIPDHLSNTVEPKYKWGGACVGLKNQIYCSFSVSDNAGNSIVSMGGVWGIDIDTKAMRLANQFSFGTYAGYATAIIPQVYNPMATAFVPPAGGDPRGVALYIGWQNGISASDSTLCGVDQPSSNGGIYTGGQSYLVSDGIPIGTFLKPITSAQVEYKLTDPLQSGESVQILVASSLAVGTNPTFTPLGTTNGTGSELSDNFPLAVQEQQWMYIKVISTGISSNPSFNRLTELRIIHG